MGGIEQRKEECRDTRGVRLDRGLPAGRPLRGAHAAPRAGVHRRGDRDLDARHRHDGRHVHRRQRRAAAAAAVSAAGSALPGRAVAEDTSSWPSRGWPTSPTSQFRERDRTFQHLAAFSSYKGNLAGAGDPVVLKMADVTTEFFDALGVGPAMGRTFLLEPTARRAASRRWCSATSCGGPASARTRRSSARPSRLTASATPSSASCRRASIFPARWRRGRRRSIKIDSRQFAAGAGRRPAEAGRHHRAGARRVRDAPSRRCPTPRSTIERSGTSACCRSRSCWSATSAGRCRCSPARCWSCC